MAKLPTHFFIDRKKFYIKYWNKEEANKVQCDGQFDLDDAVITINKDLKPLRNNNYEKSICFNC